MPRPTKDGFDYFPLDTNTDNNIKLQIVEARYGIVGFGIIIKLFQRIYGDKGYYCEWNELIAAISASKWSCTEFPVTEKLVSKVVREAARYGIFDKKMLNDYGILTSKGIQERYLEIGNRRKNLEIKPAYLLISIPNNHINANNNRINANNNFQNVSKNKQSKVKESKGKERESREKAANAFFPPSLSQIKKFVSNESLKINPEKFYYYYQSKKWKGINDWKSKAKEWDCCERTTHSTNTSYAAYDLVAAETLINSEE